MQWLVDAPIAHRGLHGDKVPENSLPAFQAAMQAGYAIELDVRLTADEVPVVFHDARLDRLTEATGPLADQPWSRVGELRLEGSKPTVPSLQAALDMIAGQVPVLVEIKNWGAPGQLEARVGELLAGYQHPVAVQSFNPRSLGWFARKLPGLPRGQVAGSLDRVDIEGWKRFLLQRLLLNWMSRPAFIAYEHTALPYGPVALARGLGLPVVAWTVTTPEQGARVAPHVDNVIFEGYRPAVPRA